MAISLSGAPLSGALLLAFWAPGYMVEALLISMTLQELELLLCTACARPLGPVSLLTVHLTQGQGGVCLCRDRGDCARLLHLVAFQ